MVTDFAADFAVVLVLLLAPLEIKHVLNLCLDRKETSADR